MSSPLAATNVFLHYVLDLWVRFHRLARRWLPKPKILHPYPNVRFRVAHPRQEPDEVMLQGRICAGAPGNRRPYRESRHCDFTSRPLTIPAGADRLEDGGPICGHNTLWQRQWRTLRLFIRNPCWCKWL